MRMKVMSSLAAVAEIPLMALQGVAQAECRPRVIEVVTFLLKR